MSVGKTIKEIRKQRNLTQKQLADQIKISRSYLSDIENGNKNPSIKTTQQLAEKLGVSPTYLISGNKMYSDLSDEEKRQAFLKMNKQMAEDNTTREQMLKDNLLGLIRSDLDFLDVHYLNNAYNFYELEKQNKDNLLFISVLLQQLYNYKGLGNTEAYNDIINDFDDFLKQYLNIK
ncbi:helix-turn-helix transcriptional regulator [Staphylococcus simulans]|uniref:helix-turn-helix domain-containing protein n=1 Tax=Staphylococcus simulans TaxID=1286 RepID=UPI00280B8DCA|nr:helix-turn-helix transcriptional regulator [Staphylococcus simulans]WMM11535.1 helix-turn-helix transcriptional regulator [Staphylococcus simulans]